MQLVTLPSTATTLLHQIVLLNRFAPTRPSDPKTWEVWDLLRPHAEALLRKAEKLTTPDVSLLAGRLGTFLWAKGLPGEAEPLMRRALALDETLFGREHPHVAIQLNNLALVLQDTGRPHEAEPLMREAVKIFNKALGPDDPSTRGVRKNLELLLEELGYRHNW